MAQAPGQEGQKTPEEGEEGEEAPEKKRQGLLQFQQFLYEYLVELCGPSCKHQT